MSNLRRCCVAGLLLATSAAAGGCGGRLKYRIQDAALDSVPPAERLELAAAQQELEKARGEQALLQSQADPLARDRDSAEKERAQLQRELDRARGEQEAAVKTRDENRAAAAERAREVAGFGMKTAEARLDWLMQRRDWLRAALRAADLGIDSAAARVELEKARVASKHNIKTREDNSVGSFESQWKDMTSHHQAARADAAEQEKKAKDLEQKWQNLRTQQAKLTGS